MATATGDREKQQAMAAMAAAMAAKALWGWRAETAGRASIANGAMETTVTKASTHKTH